MPSEEKTSSNPLKKSKTDDARGNDKTKTKQKESIRDEVMKLLPFNMLVRNKARRN